MIKAFVSNDGMAVLRRNGGNPSAIPLPSKQSKPTESNSHPLSLCGKSLMHLRGFPLPHGDTEESTGYEPGESVKAKPKERVIVHSDQGSQYGSGDWLRLCKVHKIDPSMSRRGNCWYNAVAESFSSSRGNERIRRRNYRTRSLARADIFDCVEMFHNRIRRHSHLGGVSPEAFEHASKEAL